MYYTKLVLKEGEYIMTPDNKVIVIKPQGAQGGGFSVEVQNKDQFQKFDEAVGTLSEADRKKVEKLKEKAHEVGLAVVDN